MANSDGERLPVPEEKILDTSKTTLTNTRGKTALAKFGLGENYFNAFEQNIKKAAAYKSDEQITDDIKTLTRLKNEKLALAVVWGDDVKTRMDLAFAKNPGVIKEFPTNFTKAKHDELTMLEVIPEINNLIDKYTVQLQARGLPADHKEKGVIIRTELNDLNKQQEALKGGRKSYTTARIAAYRVLYDSVNEINKAGRKAYANNPADLRVFDSPWPAAEKKSENKNNTDDAKKTE